MEEKEHLKESVSTEKENELKGVTEELDPYLSILVIVEEFEEW